MTERSVVTWDWGCGWWVGNREKQKRGISKRPEETFGGDDFTGILKFQNISNCIFEICALYQISIMSQ